MSEDVQPKDDARPAPAGSGMGRRIGIYAAILLIVFLAGFVPMWLKARASSDELSKTKQQLSLARIQNSLSAAVIDARRGEYEPARESASNFFNELRAEIDRGEASALTRAQRDGAPPLFGGRDELITLLARGDPSSADRLSNLYASYRKLIGG